MSDTDIKQVIAYQGEMMLAGWTESHNGGRKVTFWLPDDTPEHPFKAFTAKAGKVAGQRFAVVFVQIDDNEQPVIQHPAANPEPEMKGGELAKLAGMLCNNPDFWVWMEQTRGAICHTPDGARNFILAVCGGLRSRRELDHNKQAGEIFRYQIYGPFNAWMDTL